VLPLLIVADMIGYWINKKGGSWAQVWRMAPPAMLGVVVGWWLLNRVDDDMARWGIGILILCLLGLKLLMDAGKQCVLKLVKHQGFAIGMGFTAGVVTMLANAAGPVMTIYLLAQKLDKPQWLGVFSRYFLLMNLFKLPFSFQLGIVNQKTLMTNLLLLPGVIAGVFIGAWLLKRMSQQVFEMVLMILTAVAAVWLIAA
jgi:uncharacterized protein